eukprot:4619481-Pleurochrysis_carterae.AAC.1
MPTPEASRGGRRRWGAAGPPGNGVQPNLVARGPSQPVVSETPVRSTATAVALRVAARQCGACFEASYHETD